MNRVSKSVLDASVALDTYYKGTSAHTENEICRKISTSLVNFFLFFYIITCMYLFCIVAAGVAIQLLVCFNRCF